MRKGKTGTATKDFLDEGRIKLKNYHGNMQLLLPLSESFASLQKSVSFFLY